MQETVISIQKLVDGGGFVASLKAPAAVGGTDLCPLDFNSLPDFTPLTAATYGLELRKALDAHPAIKSHLQALDASLIPDPLLTFELCQAPAEGYRWEAVGMPGTRFLAVDSATPLGRVAGVERADVDARLFKWPLRIAAFASAAGVSAKEEVLALTSEVAKARQSQTDVCLDLYLGEHELIEWVTGEITSGKAPGVAVFPIPPNGPALKAVLDERPADVIHFFCHGIVSSELEGLQLATVAEQISGTDIGSIQLPISWLAVLPSLKKSWVVVLNCCESAVAGKIGSMAYRIANQAGVPFCVGMNEPIASADANAFTESFYSALFKVFDGLSGSQDAQTVDFRLAMYEPRFALAQRCVVNANACWAVPAFYKAGRALRVKPMVNLPAAMQVRLDTVAKFLRDMPPDTPTNLRTDVLKLLDDVPLSMRPDAFGQILGENNGG